MKPASQSWPPSAILLCLYGIALVGIGLFFIVMRPALLPEDTRYIGVSITELQGSYPNFVPWLFHVFRVLGGYALATGVLTITLATTSFRSHHWVAGIGALIAGAASIGWMAVVNFLINSDFKWVLLGIAIVWIVSLMLFWFEIMTSRKNLTR